MAAPTTWCVLAVAWGACAFCPPLLRAWASHPGSLPPPLSPLPRLQITDVTQALLPVANQAGDAKYIGFLSANGISTSTLVAFLNGGFLLPANTGVDIRIVSVDSGLGNIQFQWKTSSQKVRRGAQA